MKRKNVWTMQAIDCYNRGCICRGCDIYENYNFVCNMKIVVLDLVREFGVPRKRDILSLGDKAVINAILEGNETIMDIAFFLNKNKTSTLGALCTLYKKARKFYGASFNKKTKHGEIFPQFIEFVKRGGFNE